MNSFFKYVNRINKRGKISDIVHKYLLICTLDQSKVIFRRIVY